jgi:hypothetical protein
LSSKKCYACLDALGNEFEVQYIDPLMNAHKCNMTIYDI